MYFSLIKHGTIKIRVEQNSLHPYVSSKVLFYWLILLHENSWKQKFSYLGSLHILWMHDTPRDILASWVHVIDFKRWPCWYVRASRVKGGWKCGGAFVERVTLGRKSEQTLLRADGGMLARRFALGGRPPQSTNSSAAFHSLLLFPFAARHHKSHEFLPATANITPADSM